MIVQVRTSGVPRHFWREAVQYSLWGYILLKGNGAHGLLWKGGWVYVSCDVVMNVT